MGAREADQGTTDQQAAETAVDAPPPIGSPRAAEPEVGFEPPPRSGGDGRPMMLAIGALAAWSAFFAFAHWNDADLAVPRGWSALTAQWASVALLIGLAWLIEQRLARRAARGWRRAAGALGDEAELLEARLAAMNRELSLAREFIAAQSRDLETVGRVAADRLNQSAGQLRELVLGNGDRIDAIGAVSRTALDNMEQLRGQLPVLTNATRDMTNTIGAAGRDAQEHALALREALRRIGDAGLASEQQVRSLRGTVDAAVAEFTRQSEQLAWIADARFAALTERGAAFRDELDAYEIAALTAVRARAGALADELARAREGLETEEERRIAALRQRIALLRDDSARVADDLGESETRAAEGWRAALARVEADVGAAFVLIDNADRDAFDASRKRLIALSDDVDRIDAGLDERQRGFVAQASARRDAARAEERDALAALDQRLDQLDAAIAARRGAHERHTAALAAHGEAIAARLGDSEQHLASVAAHASEANVGLAQAVAALEARLIDSRDALATTGGELEGVTDTAARLLDLLRASTEASRETLPPALAANEARLRDAAAGLAAVTDGLDDAQRRGEQLAVLLAGAAGGLKADFAAIASAQASAADRTSAHGDQVDALKQALVALDQAHDRLLGRTRGEFAQTLAALIRQLADASADALDRALRTGVATIAGRLEQAAAHAVGVSSEAAVQLRGEIGKVEALTTSLESRVVDVRQRAETRVDHQFAQRAALITERLKSSAIDIAGALEADVPETAWAGYLKGDRGVFGRRAVRLLDAAQAREVATLYANDAGFHDTVSRYIHDFEAMLREVLSTHNGEVLAVTLLSSDLGKLYVALAQTIERLRG